MGLKSLILAIAIAGQSNGLIFDWSLVSRDVKWINCAKGGSFIKDWNTESKNYLELVNNINGENIKVILWWQGEAESRFGFGGLDYYQQLTNLAFNVYQSTGAKLMPCLIEKSSNSPFNKQVNEAIIKSWKEPFILKGPDLSDLMVDDNEGYHIMGLELRREVAKRWVEAINNSKY